MGKNVSSWPGTDSMVVRGLMLSEPEWFRRGVFYLGFGMLLGEGIWVVWAVGWIWMKG